MTKPNIHPTAVVGENVTIGENTTVGPYCVLEDNCVIGANTVLMASVYVGRYTTIGENNKFFPFSTIGVIPQDLKFEDKKTETKIGNRNVIREHCTIHRGTVHGGGVTEIGDDNLIMVSSHIAHDCRIGSRNILSHAATLAGHVIVGSDATVGAYSGVHQFCRVGDYAFIGGYSVVTKDALPFVKTVGNRAKIYGINGLGLERKGFSAEEISGLKSAYRILFLKGERLVDALVRLKDEFPDAGHVKYLVSFIENSERGIVR